MSKFLVDELPYYGDECIFFTTRMCYQNSKNCPRYWDKYKVTSEDNPHECLWLKEYKGENNESND